MANFKILSKAELKDAINSRIDSYLRIREADALKIDIEYGNLIKELRIFIARGGKRMRPYLAYLSYVGSGGKQIDDFLDTAISIELLHNYLLIHDDIIDRDFHRYGGLNIAGTYQRQFDNWMSESESKHLSGSTALLAGDVDAVFCSDIIIGSIFSDSIKLALLSEINRTIFVVGGGEYLDTLAPHNKNVDENYLEKVYKFKSADYSIEMPLHFGALAAGKETHFKKFSYPIGFAFQLVDDLLGMFGDEKIIGKPVLSDLHEGKKTILMLKTLQLANTEQKKTLLDLLGNEKATLLDLEIVRKIINETGAHQYVQDKAKNNLAAAINALDSIDLEPESIEALEQLAQFIISRNY